VPAGPAPPETVCELERTQDGIDGGTHDMQHHRQGRRKKRALAEVISAPTASWLRRKAPAASGMTLSTSSAATSHFAEAAFAGALVF
jgi:hypothetical protein